MHFAVSNLVITVIAETCRKAREISYLMLFQAKDKTILHHRLP